MIDPRHLENTGVEVTSPYGMLARGNTTSGTILFSNMKDLLVDYDYVVVAISEHGHRAGDLPREYREAIPAKHSCYYYRKNEIEFVFDDGLDNWI